MLLLYSSNRKSSLIFLVKNSGCGGHHKEYDKINVSNQKEFLHLDSVY